MSETTPETTTATAFAALDRAIAAARAEGAREMRERAAQAARNALPIAHTYGSENADLYRGQDRALKLAAAAIRALPLPGEEPR